MPFPPHLRPSRSVLAVISLVLGITTHVSAETVVVTDSRTPIKNSVGVRVIYLDNPEIIQQQLSAGLPNDPQIAAFEVKRRMSGDRGEAINKRLRDAHQGVADAWGWGVTKIPAVVVDGQYVVYGNADVARAQALVADYRAREGR
ncbi:TIGR03757 family integrating conjugative element protein [Pseudomonas caricapapayae]|uniref:TIGR03757 family integrating conjugative element protein n=1 Tax=Pseudomonas caricapapayae TaxID=46678 RepID=UPI000EFDB6E4|nr:TIGR03757 family integrating conjugative element protein [Pseudomonas caricapapayae]